MNKNRSMFSSVAMGLIAGAAIGAVAAGMSSDKNRRKIKRSAEKTVKSMSDFAKDLTEMVRD